MTLELKGVAKTDGTEIHIHPTDLTLIEDGFNVLLGATGAGKTTLIKLMAGLEQPTEGRIWLNGEDITSLSPQRRRVSLVHQFFVNYPHVSVYENIASPLRVGRVDSKSIDRRVRETAELLRLTPMLDRKPGELSGGQQQRTALARAIAKESRAVFLDEPLANLDYKLREELREQLPELFAGRGSVVVYATSEPEEALLLGGETALMQDGMVVQFGPTADIYRQPETLSAAQVFSNPPINHAQIVKSGQQARLASGAQWYMQGVAANLPDGMYTIAIRPHHVSPTPGSGPSVALNGTVQVTELSGSESSAHFIMGEDAWVSLAHGVHPYRVGEERQFFMDPSRCFVFAPDGRLVA